MFKKANKPKFIRTKKPRIDKDMSVIMNAVRTALVELVSHHYN